MSFLVWAKITFITPFHFTLLIFDAALVTVGSAVIEVLVAALAAVLATLVYVLLSVENAIGVRTVH